MNKKEIFRAACNIIAGNREISRKILKNTKTSLFHPQKMLLELGSFLPRNIAGPIVRFFLFRWNLRM